jgi:uncharacterized surface protein with fasciclin (FAS1) repeats
MDLDTNRSLIAAAALAAGMGGIRPVFAKEKAVTVGGAPMQSNGVIHVIDTVLLPG